MGTTPPCKPGAGLIHWIMAHELIHVDPATVSQYRELINANPMNQLAAFRNIVSTKAYVVSDVPDWHPSSGLTQLSTAWNTSLGCNVRPVQKLNDAGKTKRKVYYVTSSIEGPIMF